MSLINEMLRDLEARGSNEPGEQVRSAPPSGAPRRSAWPFVAIGMLAIALVAAVFMLRQGAPGESPAVAATSRAIEIEPATASDANRTPVVEAVVVPARNSTPASAPVIEDPARPVTSTADAAPVAEPVVEPAPKVAAAKVEPAEDTASENQAVIVRRHEPTPEDIAARAGRDGFAALRNGDWATAARLLQELVAFEAANDDAREGLVVALTRQGRIAEADGALIDGMAVGTAPARFAKLRARLQASRGELDAALASLSIAVPDVGADPEYHALKAALAQQAERYGDAAEVYATLTAFEPANGTWQAGLGMALDKLGDSGSARGAYERALAAGQLDAALLAHVQRRLQALTDQER